MTVDPGSGRLAFAEGWASDRGLVAGVVVVLAPDGQVEWRIEDLPADVTWLGWDGSRSIVLRRVARPGRGLGLP